MPEPWKVGSLCGDRENLVCEVLVADGMQSTSLVMKMDQMESPIVAHAGQQALHYYAFSVVKGHNMMLKPGVHLSHDCRDKCCSGAPTKGTSGP